MAGPAKESIAEVGGYKFRVSEAGTGPTLLFLHGAGGSNWSPLLQRLAADWRVIAPEHPGFGRSQIPDWMMSVGDVAFFYLDVLAALNLRNVHLVGHSIGGWIAAEIAIRSTERLDALTLMAPAGVAVAEAPFGDIFLWNPEERTRKLFHDQKLADERIRALPNQDIDVALQNQAAVARLAWNPRLHNPQLARWLHRIKIPTLLIWGEEDQIVPFACRRPFLEQIPQAELMALSASGHALHVERAAEIAARLAASRQGARP
jgi:pimeloyl-ACP methyl ester carboxylesterase